MNPLVGSNLNEFISLRESLPKVNNILDNVYGNTSNAEFDPNKLSYTREEVNSMLVEINRKINSLEKRIELLEDEG